MTDISRRDARRKTVQNPGSVGGAAVEAAGDDVRARSTIAPGCVTVAFSMMVSGVGSAGGAARTRCARAGWTYSLRVTLPAWGPLGPSTISNSTA